MIMKYFVATALFLCSVHCLITEAKHQNGQQEKKIQEIEKLNQEKRFSLLESINFDIKLTKWTDSEKKCVNHYLNILQNVKNNTLSAVWVWDATAFSSGLLYGSKYQLSNYDQCLNIPWVYPDHHTQYCLVDIKLAKSVEKRSDLLGPFDSSVEYFKRSTKYGRRMDTAFHGVCLPAHCTKESVLKITKILHKQKDPHPIVSIRVDSCRKSKEDINHSMGYYVFIYILVILTILTILATYWGENNSSCIFGKFLYCFCLHRNGSELVQSHRADETRSLNGIRCVTTITIVLIHHCYELMGSVANPLDFDQLMHKSVWRSIGRMDLLVDTFFAISGLLFTKGLMDNPKKNPFDALWRRYIRLIFPLALVTLYIVVASLYMGDGPIWNKLSLKQQKLCRKNWWLNILMLNNLVDTKEMCNLTAWYISCDFQLTIFGALLFYFYQKNERLGKTAFTFSLVLSCIIPGMITFWNRYPRAVFYDVDALFNLSENPVFNGMYIKPYTRASAYLTGMVLGYIMARYNPVEHSRFISKKCSIIISIMLMYVFGRLLTASGAFLREKSAVEDSLMAGLNRFLWVVAVSCFVCVCEYGDLPYVSSFLKAKIWFPFSRLSYGVYLISILIVYRNMYSSRTPLHFDAFQSVCDGFGVTFMSYFLSLFMWFMVEAPTANLLKLGKNSKKKICEETECKEHEKKLD